MDSKWKMWSKLFFIYGTGILSLFSGGFILFELFFKGLNTISVRTMTFLSIALIFLFITMLILANDFYKMKK